MLLVTRPREQAQAWVDRLRAAGVAAQSLPLLGIQPAPDPLALRQAWLRMPFYRAVMFVSPNAVDGFFNAAAPKAAWPLQAMAVAPGPGTAQALAARGVPAACIVQPPADAAQFDSESLWPQLARQAWAGAQVLVARGEGGREWLINRWREAGAELHTVVAYRRGAPALLNGEQQLLREVLSLPARHVWLLSSSEALDHLPHLIAEHAPRLSFTDWAGQAHALATHPRILEHAMSLGLVLAQACRADFESVVAAYNQRHREP